MSRAGKFIPGGARKTRALGNAPGSGKTGPIRAPEPGAAPGAPPPGKKTPAKGIGLIKPVSKGQRLPIVIMSAGVFCLLFIAAYFFAYLPEVAKERAAEKLALADQQKLTAMQKQAE